MIRVIVVFHWRVDRELWDQDDLSNGKKIEVREDPLWKVMTMPCLPPEGSTMWLKDDGGMLRDSVVDRIEWWENKPEWYEIHLEEVVIEADEEKDAIDFVRWMTMDLGWDHEATHPWKEHAK